MSIKDITIGSGTWVRVTDDSWESFIVNTTTDYICVVANYFIDPVNS